MVEPIILAALISAGAGLLTSKPFFMLLGIILFIIGALGTSWITGIPVWILGIGILFLFIIFNKSKGKK